MAVRLSKCSCCDLASVSLSTDPEWPSGRFCAMHTIAAAGCGFNPNYRHKGQILTADEAAFQRVQELESESATWRRDR